MKFEFDPTKSASNKAKHGIDFVQAQVLWEDNKLQIARSHYEHEPRSVAVGLINRKHWTMIYTERGGNIRIISVRRARENEIEHYENG